MAMQIAQADCTLEFPLASGANPRPEIQWGTVNLNKIPFQMKDAHLGRIRALSRAVELGKRYFPRCSSALDKVMDGETEPALLGRDKRSLKRKFHDLQDLVLKAFKEDTRFDISVISSSLRRPLDWS